MFQMGDDTSDWHGVKYPFTQAVSSSLTSGISSSSEQKSVTLQSISYTNTVKTTAACNTILSQSYFDSDFYGEIRFAQTSSELIGAMVYIERSVPNKEQTKDDGSYTRIEAGRILKGVYYTMDGAAKNFNVTLQGAGSLVASAGLALASSITLLNF